MKHVHIPDRGGERPRLPSAQVGPVTQAIRAMRAAEPVKSVNLTDLAAEQVRQVGEAAASSHSTFTHGIRALSRTEVETLIGDMVDLLDAAAEQGFSGYRRCL